MKQPTKAEYDATVDDAGVHVVHRGQQRAITTTTSWLMVDLRNGCSTKRHGGERRCFDICGYGWRSGGWNGRLRCDSRGRDGGVRKEPCSFSCSTVMGTVFALRKIATAGLKDVGPG
jgi:hypothetical protein